MVEVGTKVKLRKDVLVRHARSIPAHIGYTKEGFAWRKTLDELEGKEGIVTRTFPNSKHVNVEFDGKLIGIDENELVVEKQPGKVINQPRRRTARRPRTRTTRRR